MKWSWVWHFFLFVDESGQDHHDSPYEVLAGMAIEDKDLWSFICSARQLELDFFGRRYSEIGSEIKARTFLNAKYLPQSFVMNDRYRLTIKC